MRCRSVETSVGACSAGASPWSTPRWAGTSWGSWFWPLPRAPRGRSRWPLGLDSLIEIGASTVVIWELSGTGEDRQRKAMRLLGWAFVSLALYLLAQSTWVLVARFHARHSPAGIAWTGVTALVMFTLAYGKARTGTALDNPVLTTEGRVTLIDGLLATAVLLGLVLSAVWGLWWADPLAGYVIVYYGIKEAGAALTH
jgi:hypothetical protein